MFDSGHTLTDAPTRPTIRPMGSRPFRRLAWLVGALLLLQSTGGVAVAHHGGRPIGALFNCDRPGVFPPRCTSVANDLRHSVFFDSTLTDSLADSLRDSLAEDYDPTALVTSVATELTRATDVIAFSQDYGDVGAAAWVYCPPDAPQGMNAEGDRWCRMQELHFNLNSRLAIYFEDDGSRDHVACHELGHTIGLRHWGNPPESAEPAAATCMNADTPNGPTVLHQIDVDHIEAYHYVAPPPSRRIRLLSAPVAPVAQDPSGPMGDAGVEALEIERFTSLRAMTAGSDAVVRGTVVSVEPGRVFGDPDRSPLHYAAVTIRANEVLAGSLAPPGASEVILEIPLFDGPDGIDRLAATLPGGEGIFFLRSKEASARAAGMSPAEQQAEAGYHRLVVFGGMVGNDGGTAAAGGDELRVLSAVDGIPFADAVDLVRGASR